MVEQLKAGPIIVEKQSVSKSTAVVPIGGASGSEQFGGSRVKNNGFGRP